MKKKNLFQTVSFAKPKMASNNQTFDSQDELITQADQRLQWDKLTIEAIQHQIPLQVIPISSPNQPGLPHIGTVTETKRINGKQFIFMKDWSVLGNMVPKIKFDYDDIASLNSARVLTPDSSNSFSIIPMEQTNVHEHQQIFSPERASTPTNWDDNIAMDEFDLSLSPIKTHISTTSSSSSSQEPHIPITATAKRKLPVMADGFTLDQEYLELIWQMENPKIPFLEWCVDMQISDQISDRIHQIAFQLSPWNKQMSMNTSKYFLLKELQLPLIGMITLQWMNLTFP